MEANFLNDFEYGLPTKDHFLNHSRDGLGRMRTSENEGLYEKSLSFTVDRLRSDGASDPQRRQDTFNFTLKSYLSWTPRANLFLRTKRKRGGLSMSQLLRGHMCLCSWREMKTSHW